MNIWNARDSSLHHHSHFPKEFSDNYAVRWSGKLLIRKTGSYTFQVTADAAGLLSVGARVITSGQAIEMAAGAHNFRLDYCAKGGMEKHCSVKYAGPDTHGDLVVVPAAVLQHEPISSMVVEKPGFIAEYYPGDYSETLSFAGGTPDVTRVEKMLDFDLTEEAWPRLPEKTYGATGAFAARFTGYLHVNCQGKKRGMFKFFVESNKRAQLYLNDGLLLDFSRASSDDVELTAGSHLLTVVYFSRPGEAHGLKLKYSGPDTLPKQTKQEEDAETKAWEDYVAAKKKRQDFLDDPPEAEEGEEPPEPPPEPEEPEARIPEIHLVGPTVTTHFSLDSCCVPKGEPLLKHKGGITCVAFSMDEGFMITGGEDGNLQVWTYQDGSHHSTISVGSPINCVCFPPTTASLKGDSGSTLHQNVAAVGLESGQIMLYDAAEGTEMKSLNGHTGAITSLVFHPEHGEELIKDAGGRRMSSSRRTSKNPGEEGGAEEGRADSKTDAPPSAAAGTRPNLFSSSNDGTVRMWNSSIGEETSNAPGCLTLPKMSGIAQLSVSIACNGLAAVSGGTDGILRYYDADASDFVRGPDKVLPLPPEPEEGWTEENPCPEPETVPGDPIYFQAHQAAITCCNWSPVNPKKLVTASADATVIIWDMWDEGQKNLQPTHLIDPIQNLTRFAMWSPDAASLLCSNEDTNVQMFSAVSGLARTLPMPNHVATVNAAAWSPLGQCLATVSDDSTVRMWHFRLNRDIQEITSLEREQAEFNHDMLEWQKLLDKIRKQFKDYEAWAQYEADIYLLRQSLDTGKERTQSYNERESLLGLQLSDYYELDGMIDDYKPYFTLWDSCINFQKLSKLWHEKPLVTINAPKVEEQLDQVSAGEFRAEVFICWLKFFHVPMFSPSRRGRHVSVFPQKDLFGAMLYQCPPEFSHSSLPVVQGLPEDDQGVFVGQHEEREKYGKSGREQGEKYIQNEPTPHMP